MLLVLALELLCLELELELELELKLDLELDLEQQVLWIGWIPQSEMRIVLCCQVVSETIVLNGEYDVTYLSATRTAAILGVNNAVPPCAQGSRSS